MPPSEKSFSRSLLAGATAGLAVDLTLYPLDTMKTRIQSESGFRLSGGFTRPYAGIPSVLIGSAPGAALFFSTYETIKTNSNGLLPPYQGHMLGASIGEVVACSVRVPTEVIKQRTQAYPTKSSFYVFRRIIVRDGLVGFYRGYLATIAREIPFSLVQFPLWEVFKKLLVLKFDRPTASSFQSALCGSLAGSIAAAVTTPLDLVKTRLMLSDRLHGRGSTKAIYILGDMYRAAGVSGLFAGVLPRTIWMGLGGFVFFGVYEAFISLLLFIRPAPRMELTRIIPDDKPKERRWWNRSEHWYMEPKRPLFGEEMMAETEKLVEKRRDFIRRRKEVLEREDCEYERLELRKNSRQ